MLFGILGASDLASGLGIDTGASGHFGHAKRCKTGERREKIAKELGCPRILFIGGWSLGVRGAYAFETSLHASSEELECEGRHASLYAGRTLVRGAYFG